MGKEEILEQIKSMTVLELKELVDALQEEFGVTAAAPVMAMPGVGVAGAVEEAEEEQTEFNVLLTNVGEKKIQVIKVVRELTSLGLKEAKDLVESAPDAVVAEGVSKDDGETMKAKLEEVGASVQVK